MTIKNNIASFSNYLKDNPILLIWAGIVAFTAIINEWLLTAIWGSTGLTFLTSIISILYFIISNPFVVGFIYTFFYSKDLDSKVMNGAWRGALAAFIIGGVGYVMSSLSDPIAFIMLLPSLVRVPIEGAIAGSIAVLTFGAS